MAYPEVPELNAFDPTWTPNLMTGGSYDEQLVKIEEYLKTLGAYIDSNVGTGGYVLPQATSTTLGGVYVADDSDFEEYMGI